MASFTGAGDSLELLVRDIDEDVTISISGTYDMTILFQREVGSPGSGAWETIKSFSTANATVSELYRTARFREKLRLFVSVDTSGTAVATLTDGDKVVQTLRDGVGNPLATFRQSGVTFPGTAEIEGALAGDLTFADTAIIKKFSSTVTLATDGATTSVGLTPDGIVLSAAIRVSTAITALDSADHHIQLGVSGTLDKYCDVANGEAATSIALNKKGHYVGNPVGEAAALILTITGGADMTPDGGAVEVEVVYIARANLADG